MLRAPLVRACLGVLWSTVCLAAAAGAQGPAAPGGLHDVAVPHRLHHVLGRGDPGAAQAVLDFIRRTYDNPARASLGPDAVDAASHDGENGADPRDAGTFPLPLSPDTWIAHVFGGRASPETLFGAIMDSRNPALFYYGLLSLDDATRAWLETEPRLIAELSGRQAAPFALAAPGVRVRGAGLVLPGGPAAVPAWEALAGAQASDPAGFLRALLAKDKGRLASFFGAMAELTPRQLEVAFRLDSPDPAARVAASRQLSAVFGRLTPDWRLKASLFSRAAIDPALLLTHLRHDAEGRPVLPGTRGFWRAVFATAGGPLDGPARDDGADGEAADFAWLCQQVFAGRPDDDRRRYDQVLFASRLDARNARWEHPDARAAVRAASAFPALVYSLERARLADVRAFAAAARRAERTAAIRDAEAAARVLAQFQGALALVTRAASRGGLRPEALAAAVASLSRVEFDDRGRYEGRLVTWLGGWLAAHQRHAPASLPDVPAAGAIERDALSALAGPARAPVRFVDWEGTRYRLDFPAAEAHRLVRLLGGQPRPYLSSAQALVEMAGAIGRDAGRLRQHAQALEDMAIAVAWSSEQVWERTTVPRRARDATSAVRQAAERGDLRRAADAAPALLALADDLLARGLTELAYAVALGQPDRPAISADEAASRHRFLRASESRPTAWEFPVRGPSPRGRWEITGSLLGLDIELGDFALVRLSRKPPPRAPTVTEYHRRLLIDAVILMEAASLTEEDHATLVSALRRGRARLAAPGPAGDLPAIADDARLGPARRTLMAWAAANGADVAGQLGPTELLWLGLVQQPPSGALHAWGAPAWPRTGCLCLDLLQGQSPEPLAGRGRPGAFHTAFADLHLRLAELLEDLGMPGALLAPVLAAATTDLIETAEMRDADDRQALLTFVHALTVERVEQYLALLTTRGPLVPAGPGETP